MDDFNREVLAIEVNESAFPTSATRKESEPDNMPNQPWCVYDFVLTMYIYGNYSNPHGDPDHTVPARDQSSILHLQQIAFYKFQPIFAWSLVREPLFFSQ